MREMPTGAPSPGVEPTLANNEKCPPLFVDLRDVVLSDEWQWLGQSEKVEKSSRAKRWEVGIPKSSGLFSHHMGWFPTHTQQALIWLSLALPYLIPPL